MKLCRVTKKYKTGYPVPLRVQKDEEIKPGQGDGEYNGWTFCTDAGGRVGWVPDYLIHKADDQYTIREDYSALEFDIEAGEELEFIEEYFGWIKCRREGVIGWIPAENCIITSENRK